MNTIKVNVSAENPVQDLGSRFSIRYVESYEYQDIVGLFDSDDHLIGFVNALNGVAQKNMQKFVEELQVALTEKESESQK